jgi:pimeloyl-ACP methyl ester carboxylesterase
MSVDAWREAGTFLELSGYRMFYRREGRGVPLVLVHGYPTSSWDWAHVWADLAAQYDVIALDMLGFGESAKPHRHRYTIGEQANLHTALLAKLGIERFHAIVHDYGVTVGQELLARGAPMDSIAFLNGGLFPETHRPRPIQRLLASPIGPLIARLTNERAFAKSFAALFAKKPSPEEMHAFWGLASKNDGLRALAGLISYMAERRENRERWVGAFVNATLPLLVINGSRDPVSGEHMVERLLQLRPETSVVRLPDIGHYPQVEAPAEVLAAYAKFRQEFGLASST